MSWKLRPLARIWLISESSSRSLAVSPPDGWSAVRDLLPESSCDHVAVKLAVKLVLRTSCSVLNRRH